MLMRACSTRCVERGQACQMHSGDDLVRGIRTAVALHAPAPAERGPTICAHPIAGQAGGSGQQHGGQRPNSTRTRSHALGPRLPQYLMRGIQSHHNPWRPPQPLRVLPRLPLPHASPRAMRPAKRVSLRDGTACMRPRHDAWVSRTSSTGACKHHAEPFGMGGDSATDLILPPPTSTLE